MRGKHCSGGQNWQGLSYFTKMQLSKRYRMDLRAVKRVFREEAKFLGLTPEQAADDVEDYETLFNLKIILDEAGSYQYV